MSSGIFISYRRADSRHAAGRMADELGAAFGEANIFRDIEGIDIGVNFEQALERALGSCVVMLVVIGPQWLDAKDDAGRRRLDQPGDWTRQEIATALKRGIPVAPVLLEGTPLPRADQLPDELRELVNRQQYELSDGHWRGDMKTLVDKLARVKGLQRVGPVPAPAPAPQPPAKRKLHWGWWVAGGVAIFFGALWNEFETSGGAANNGIAFQPPAAAAPMQPAVNTTPATAPNLAGLWRTASGETYHFQQEGHLVRFTAEANGQNVGNGSGELEGNVLRLQMTMQLNGVFMGNLICNMQAAPDMRSFTGTCAGPRGQFGAQFFR